MTAVQELAHTNGKSKTTGKASTSTPTVTIEIVDPATAQEWLAFNTRNRRKKRAKIAEFSRDMGAGHWRLTGDSIKFSRTGVLLDGQNRLFAVIEADAPIQTVVVRGLEDEAQSVMDTGTKRTVADVLDMSGETYGPLLAATAALIFTDIDRRPQRASTTELIGLVEDDPTIRDAVLATVNHKIPGLTGTVAAYSFWRLTNIDPDAAATFYEGLRTLVNLPARSPILALQRRLTARATDNRYRDRRYRQETISMVFYAWNAWRRDEARDSISIRTGAGGRIIIPEPK